MSKSDAMAIPRPVTERDLRDPKYGDGDPGEFEFLRDGSIARKDRWERGIRLIHGVLGMDPRATFEVSHVVAEVKRLIAVKAKAPSPSWSTHRYPESDGTEDCENGCGCWVGNFNSGGPIGIDPFGECPNAKQAEGEG